MRVTSSIDQTGVDRDGVLMLMLTLLLILVTLGLSYLVFAFQTYRKAQRLCRHSCAPFPIVVPGKQLENGQPDSDYRLRLQRSLALWQTNTAQPVWLLGGPTDPEHISEAEAGYRFFMASAPEMAPSIHLEAHSRNTLENLKQLRAAFHRHQWPLQIRLVSNRYHLPRCGAMAKRLGFHAILVAAEESNPALRANGRRILIEALLYHWYHTGASLSQWLNHPRMLKKIS
ncbi:MAG: YdcF family protein [Hydrogenovibrio sp.]|uniref:YdcF family protein n=1 Tax=Hydrogenovibrio sp. TaxID=2065821 RepID=UPI002870343C|nr:YdcF family protein [Hydrogenovibrio sp.]MDR9499680.1 YdcF family protein [Hydrogenovibrio sp.]